MADILFILSYCSKLHGILILVKPNDSHLTVVFELLTHLHWSAANNIVFGFTNTRGSNYQPEDTFMLLQSLLKQYEDKDLPLELYQNNVYCFNSESVRNLAAHNQGVDMGRLEDYCRSWEQSAKESRRLMCHFRSLIPYQVEGTLNLNRPRHILFQLTKSITEISQSIKRSISVNEARAKELEEMELAREELEKYLWVEKVTLMPHALDQPRTVCGNKECIKADSVDEGGKQVSKTVYKTHCHSPCYCMPQKVRWTSSMTQNSPSVMLSRARVARGTVGCAGMCGKNTCISCMSCAKN